MTFEAKIKFLDRELNSPGNGHSDFYWVDVRAFEKLKPKEKASDKVSSDVSDSMKEDS